MAQTIQRAETAADGNLLTYNPPKVAGVYRLTVILEYTSGSGTEGWTATWKDGNGVARATTNLSLFEIGVAAPALTYASVVSDFYGQIQITIDSSGTAIVIKTTGGSLVYLATAIIEQLS